MGEVLHRSPTMTEAIRRAIEHRQKSLITFSKRYGIIPLMFGPRAAEFAGVRSITVLSLSFLGSQINMTGKVRSTRDMARQCSARKSAFMGRIGSPSLLWAVVLLIASAVKSFAQTTPEHQPEAGVRHDGSQDFDFEIGNWNAHVRKLVHPLSGSDEWDEYYGKVSTRSLPMLQGWNESEMDVTSPKSNNRIEILAVRLYNPTSRQWSIYGSSLKTGTFDPPEIGEFINKRGEFYAQDTFGGRAIYVRYVWEDLTPDSTHFEQSFSADGGKTWEVNWVYDGVRVK